MSTQDSYMAEKTKPTEPNQKPEQPNCPNPLGISYFCEFRLHAKFQLPKLCLIYMYTQDSYMAEKNQSSQTKPKTRPNKLSNTTWNILFLWVETEYQISAS